MASDTAAHQERERVSTESFMLLLQSIGLAFVSKAVVLVLIATLVTVGVFVVTPTVQDGWSRAIAPAAGIAGAFLIAICIGWNRRNYWDDPEQVDQWNFGRFCQRFTTLEAREQSLGETLDPSSDTAGGRIAMNEQHRVSRAEARAHLEKIHEELDVMRHRNEGHGPSDRWINGSGYVDLWRHLYSFEEALILREDPGAVISEGRWDQLRLKRSELDNKDELLRRLENAIAVLEPRIQHVPNSDPLPPMAEHSITQSPQEESITQEAAGKPNESASVDILAPENSRNTEAPIFGTATRSQNGAITGTGTMTLNACSTVRDIRIIINDYRIQKLEGLLETRNRLILIGSVTALAAYLLLVFAILAGASQSHVIAGFTFFAVGAVVSLFDELRMGMGSRQPFEADFNLESVRIWHTPVLAGVAGVAGVVLTVLLYNTTAEQLYLPAEGSPDSISMGVASLSDVFTQDRSIHLVIAAIFGLVPGLFVDRLRQSAEKYKVGLESTSPHEQR